MSLSLIPSTASICVARTAELLRFVGFDPRFHRGKLLQAGEQAGRREGVKLIAKVFDREHDGRVRRNQPQHRVGGGRLGSCAAATSAAAAQGRRERAARRGRTHERLSARHLPVAPRDDARQACRFIRLPLRCRLGWREHPAWQEPARAKTRRLAARSTRGVERRSPADRQLVESLPPRRRSRVRMSPAQGTETAAGPAGGVLRAGLSRGVEELPAQPRGRLGRRSRQVPRGLGRAGQRFVQPRAFRRVLAVRARRAAGGFGSQRGLGLAPGRTSSLK